jgi:hypothetical protein
MMPPNQRLELAGPGGRGAMDGLMIMEAAMERGIVSGLIRRPQLKRGR